MSRIRISEPVDDPVPAEAQRIAVLIACYNGRESPSARLSANSALNFRPQVSTSSITIRPIALRRGTTRRSRGPHRAATRKGYVIQSMFRRIDADFYVMVDGDGTYPPEAVHKLLRPVLEDEADMVIGSRLHADSQSEFKQLNRLGNRLVRAVLNFIFSIRLTDILSGYRAFNRKFVKGSTPLWRWFRNRDRTDHQSCRAWVPHAGNPSRPFTSFRQAVTRRFILCATVSSS